MRAIYLVVLCMGCRAILGIDSPVTPDPDGAVAVDGAALDAPLDAPVDAPRVDAPPGVPFAIQAAAQDATDSSSLMVTFPAAVVAGDLIVVAVGAEDHSPTITVSDTLGDTFQIAAPTQANNIIAQEVVYAIARSSGADTITVTFGSKEAALDARIAEYRGVSQFVPLDVGATNTGHSNLPDVTVTTGAPNELLVAADGSIALTTAPGTGYTSRVLSSKYKALLEDRIAPTPAMYDANASLDASNDWVIQVVAFRP